LITAHSKAGQIAVWFLKVYKEVGSQKWSFVVANLSGIQVMT
jgi:hypothetical protein